MNKLLTIPPLFDNAGEKVSLVLWDGSERLSLHDANKQPSLAAMKEGPG
jgi:hypothetical protein